MLSCYFFGLVVVVLLNRVSVLVRLVNIVCLILWGLMLLDVMFCIFVEFICVMDFWGWLVVLWVFLIVWCVFCWWGRFWFLVCDYVMIVLVVGVFCLVLVLFVFSGIGSGCVVVWVGCVFLVMFCWGWCVYCGCLFVRLCLVWLLWWWIWLG